MKIFYLRHRSLGKAKVVALTLLNACSALGWDVLRIEVLSMEEIQYYVVEKYAEPSVVEKL